MPPVAVVVGAPGEDETSFAAISNARRVVEVTLARKGDAVPIRLLLRSDWEHS